MEIRHFTVRLRHNWAVAYDYVQRFAIIGEEETTLNLLMSPHSELGIWDVYKHTGKSFRIFIKTGNDQFCFNYQ